MTSAVLDREFSQADFDAFAGLSGDNNPIHVDPEFSARTRFGKTVAHGALLCAVLRGLVEKLVPGGHQLSQSVMYPSPSPADTPLRFEAEIISETDEISRLRLQVRRLSDQEITCMGETEVRR